MMLPQTANPLGCYHSDKGKLGWEELLIIYMGLALSPFYLP